MRKLHFLLRFPINFLIIFFIILAAASALVLYSNPQKIDYIPIPTATLTPSKVPTHTPIPAPTKPPKSVVFIGGSITSGSAASTYDNRWTTLLSYAIKRNYQNYSWSFYNAGVGGTPSWYGLIRLQIDVIDKLPDIVFIDFAVNDSIYSKYPHNDNPGFNLVAEALIRRIRTSLPNSQIYVWIFNWPDNYSYMNQRSRESRDNWLSLSQHYDLVLLRFDDAIKQELGSAEPTDQQIDTYFNKPGDVHPNDLGHKLAAEYAEEHLIPIGLYRPKPINEYSYLLEGANNFERLPKIIVGQDLSHSEGWVVENGSIISNTPGAEVTYSGELCSFGLDTNYGENAGKVLWSIDGGEENDLDLSTGAGRNQPVVSLKCGEHTLKITFIEGAIYIHRLLIL
jgi:lysophospholipase L1-like esterase